MPQEEAVAKGIRRITAVTKGKAEEAIASGAALEKRLAEAGQMPKLELGPVLTDLKQVCCVGVLCGCVCLRVSLCLRLRLRPCLCLYHPICLSGPYQTNIDMR